MRDYGSVHTRFWIDPDIQALSDHAKMLALYLLTGPHTNMLGCFRLPTGYVAEDLQWRAKTVTKAFTELAQTGFLSRDERSGWVLITNFLKWNPIENPNQGKSIIKLFEQVPQKLSIYPALIHALQTHAQYLPEDFEAQLPILLEKFPQGPAIIAEPSPNQVQDDKPKWAGKQHKAHALALPLSSVSSSFSVPAEVSPAFVLSPTTTTIVITSAADRCSEVMPVFSAHAQSLPDSCHEQLQTVEKGLQNPSARVLKPFRNQDQYQEQKQEQDQYQEQDLCAALKNSTAPQAQFLQPLLSVITIPLINKTEFDISQTDIDEWQALYPAVDVLQALRHIRGWNIANPKKRKTKAGILKHINHWLANAQDRGGSQQRVFKPPNTSTLHDFNTAVSQQWLQQSTHNNLEESTHEPG